MTELTAPSPGRPLLLPPESASDGRAYASGWWIAAILIVLFLINVFVKIDRILPFILAEAIRNDLGLSDTQTGLRTRLAFAVCYTLLSLLVANGQIAGMLRLKQQRRNADNAPFNGA